MLQSMVTSATCQRQEFADSPFGCVHINPNQSLAFSQLDELCIGTVTPG